MEKFASVLLLLFFSAHAPHMCRTQRISGEPVIILTKNLSDVTRTIVESATVNGTEIQSQIKGVINNLHHNATITKMKINNEVSDVGTIGMLKLYTSIGNFGIRADDMGIRICAKQTNRVDSAAAKILMEANSCVSNTVQSIEIELNDTFTSIQSILARIKSDQKLSETCVAEYDKTEMALRNAIVTALCVTQAKERIQSAIKDELSIWYDTRFLHDSSIDASKRLEKCHESAGIPAFEAEANIVYDDVIDCLKNLKPAINTVD